MRKWMLKKCAVNSSSWKGNFYIKDLLANTAGKIWKLYKNMMNDSLRILIDTSWESETSFSFIKMQTCRPQTNILLNNVNNMTKFNFFLNLLCRQGKSEMKVGKLAKCLQTFKWFAAKFSLLLMMLPVLLLLAISSHSALQRSRTGHNSNWIRVE